MLKKSSKILKKNKQINFQFRGNLIWSISKSAHPFSFDADDSLGSRIKNICKILKSNI